MSTRWVQPAWESVDVLARARLLPGLESALPTELELLQLAVARLRMLVASSVRLAVKEQPSQEPWEPQEPWSV